MDVVFLHPLEWYSLDAQAPSKQLSYKAITNKLDRHPHRSTDIVHGPYIVLYNTTTHIQLQYQVGRIFFSILEFHLVRILEPFSHSDIAIKSHATRSHAKYCFGFSAYDCRTRSTLRTSYRLSILK